MESHHQCPSSIQGIPRFQCLVFDYRLRFQFCVTNQYFIFKFGLPLHFHLILCLRDLFQSRHSLFVPLGQCLSEHCTDVTERQTRVPMPNQPGNSLSIFVCTQNTSTPRCGSSGNVYSCPFLPCIIRHSSVCSLCTNHIIAFLP